MRYRVPDDELTFRASRAGGPGGQHVNRSATRVEVLWNVRRSPSLTGEERARIFEKLAARIDKSGVLRVVADDERSQYRNRQLAAARLRALAERALAVPKPRKRTRPPRAAKERRLEQKKKRGQVKRHRQPPPDED